MAISKQLFVQYFDFLTPRQNHQLLRYTLKIENNFRPATVIDYSDEYPNWRSAKLVFQKEFETFKEMLSERIASK